MLATICTQLWATIGLRGGLGGARFGGQSKRRVGVGIAAASVVQLTHVFLEIKVTTEALSARLARVRLLVVVRVHVKGEVVYLVEGLVANGALVSLLARMGQFVVLVVAFLVEALAAELAHPRFVAVVNANVSVQR